MVNIDPKVSQAVWSRVGYDCGTNNSLVELLADFTAHAQHSHRLYNQVYITSRGALRKPMEALVRLSQYQVRRLSALYFLTVGTALPRPSPGRIQVDCLTKALQEQYQKSILARENYLAAATQFPYLGNFFENLATEQVKIQEILTNLVAIRL